MEHSCVTVVVSDNGAQILGNCILHGGA